MKPRWRDVRFDRGGKGEIEVLTQKRTKIAIIPSSLELRNALKEVGALRYGRKMQVEDFALYNPQTNKSFTSQAAKRKPFESAWKLRSKYCSIVPNWPDARRILNFWRLDRRQRLSVAGYAERSLTLHWI